MRRPRYDVLYVLNVLGFFVGCIACQMPLEASPQNRPDSDRQATSERLGDSAAQDRSQPRTVENIDDRIRQAIQDPRIDVEVVQTASGLSARLSGSVLTEEEKQSARERASFTAGVKSVDVSRIVVTSTAVTREFAIVEKIKKDALLEDPRVSIQLFEPTDDSLAVRLRGEVRSAAEAKEIKDKVVQLGVVRHVFSFLDINPDAPTYAKAKKAAQPSAKEDLVTQLWPLSFVPSQVKNAGVSERYEIAAMVEALNAIYGTDSNKKPVHSARNTLIIRATPAVALNMKRHLAALDAPAPQVQLDVWALQVSGKRGPKLEETLRNISEEIRATQLALRSATSAALFPAVTQVLEDNRHFTRTQGTLDDLREQLNFDTRRERPLSLTEMLIFIALANEQGRRSVIEKAEELLPKPRHKATKEMKAFRRAFAIGSGQNDHIFDQEGIRAFVNALIDYKFSSDSKAATRFYEKKWEDVKNDQDYIDANPDGQNQYSLDWLREAGRRSTAKHNLEWALEIRDAKLDIDYNERINAAAGVDAQKKIKKALESRLIERVTTRRMQRAPEELRRTAATADALLKAAVDAFTDDMQRLYLTPTIERLAAGKVYVKKDTPDSSEVTDGGRSRLAKRTTEVSMKDVDGVSLIGRSRLVVTSGLETGLSPELRSYVETTRRRPFGTDLLNMAFPRQRSGGDTFSKTITDTDGVEKTVETRGTSESDVFANLSGAAGLMAGLPQSQAALLAGILLSEPDPAFAQVAPGLRMHVRPAVLPDGGSARLQLDMEFGVEVSNFTDPTKRPDVLTWPQADAVKSHQVTTDTIVSAFDLFDLSSFAVTTSYPRPPGYIPVLGQLPLIGKAFQWRRKNTDLDHHSLILVNTVILPRAMDIARFYGN